MSWRSFSLYSCWQSLGFKVVFYPSVGTHGLERETPGDTCLKNFWENPIAVKKKYIWVSFIVCSQAFTGYWELWWPSCHLASNAKGKRQERWTRNCERILLNQQIYQLWYFLSWAMTNSYSAIWDGLPEVWSSKRSDVATHRWTNIDKLF